MAYHYINKIREYDLSPRALKQEAYEFIINFAERAHIQNFQIVVHADSDGMIGFPISPNHLRDNFLDLTDAR